jgi:hypothetical protein
MAKKRGSGVKIENPEKIGAIPIPLEVIARFG